MIRHWVDAFDDRNLVYLDPDFAATTRFGGLVAPPAMLQTWTMARPIVAGIAERGGAPTEVDAESALSALTDGGYTGILATNSELEFTRYLRVGERLVSSTVLESVSERKATALGLGYFVTWVSTYLVDDEAVGQQRFRVLKFDPASAGEALPREGTHSKPEEQVSTGEELPPFDLDVTSTVIVAGAIASRDFMPVHHDREYARAQGAPDMFMNILTSTGYVARFATDWAGPEAQLRSIAIRLGVPAVPDLQLRFRGRVVDTSDEGDERVLEVALQAANDLGNHVTGTVTLSRPA
jgi:acyl dehydratase